MDVMDTGFTMPEIIVMEGQGVLFEKGGRKTLEIVQVINKMQCIIYFSLGLFFFRLEVDQRLHLYAVI